MLNLLDLEYSIINYLLSTKNANEINCFSERRLRPLTRLSKEAQLKEFKRILFELDSYLL